MGMFDKLKEFMGIPEEDYEEEEEEAVPERHSRGSVGSALDDEPYVEVSKRNNKVVNIHATTQLQVVIVKPEKFDEASTIADHLNDKHTVVLNLESCEKDISRRLVDFLSGVAYANRGQIKKVANCTYIITPYHVDIMGDLIDELENSGVFF